MATFALASRSKSTSDQAILQSSRRLSDVIFRPVSTSSFPKRVRDLLEPAVRRVKIGCPIPFWIIVCAAAVIFVTAIGIGIGAALKPKPIDPAPLPGYQGRNLSLGMTLLSEDPLANGGSIDVSFNVYDDTCSSDGPDSCSPVNIYMTRWVDSHIVPVY